MTVSELAERLDKIHTQWIQGLLTEREYVLNCYRAFLLFDAKNA